MAKKLSSEELEQDILIEYSSRFMHFYNRNKAAVIGGAIGIVAVIGLLIGYFIYADQQEDQAQVLLGIAEQYYIEGNYEAALNGSETDFTIGFKQISTNFGSTNAGNLATYFAAVTEFEMDNYESALNYIEQYNAPRGILGVAPISLHANILSELEKYEEAAAMFVKAANWDQNSNTTPIHLYEAAQAFHQHGDQVKALTHLDTILEEYPNSQTVTKAQQLRGRLMLQG